MRINLSAFSKVWILSKCDIMYYYYIQRKGMFFYRCHCVYIMMCDKIPSIDNISSKTEHLGRNAHLSESAAYTLLPLDQRYYYKGWTSNFRIVIIRSVPTNRFSCRQEGKLYAFDLFKRVKTILTGFIPFIEDFVSKE